jgi:uncharacterized protein (DUF2235 family)
MVRVRREASHFDENRSNIYKLYRATRVGPDSCIDPSQQIAYYDAGLGAIPSGGGSIYTAYRWVYNTVSQATGFGLTANIIDCYEFIIRNWHPGDRVYLFGFSRGAYTARCVAAALVLCGIPTKMKDGSPLKKDSDTIRPIAKIAIKRVYQHTTSMHYDSADQRTKELLDQRKELAARFRKTYGADDTQSGYPYFVGVFDTVAAIANPNSRNSLMIVGVAILLALSWLLALWKWSFWWWLCLLGGTAASLALLVYLWTHVKWEIGLKRTKRWRLFHFTILRMRDWSLSQKIAYAKEALSIHENWADFDRVPWGTRGVVWPVDSKGNKTFEQVWFAGNHSDIGGSYPENESRLSDIALDWMVTEATSIEHPILLDRSVLRLYPSPDGMQHDECKVGIKFLTRLTGRTWKIKTLQLSDPDFKLHPTVIERFDLPGVLQYDVIAPYRPVALATHKDFKDHPDYAKVRK